MRRSRWARWLVALLAATLSLGCTQATPTPVPAFVSATPAAAAPLASSPTPPRSPTPAPTPTPQEPWIVGCVPLYHLPGQGIEPRAMAATEGRLYVANAQSANLSVIEGGQVVATIAAGAEPIALAADRAGRVYVLDGRESQLLVIEGAAVVRRWTIPPGSGSLAVVGETPWIGTGDGRLLALSPEGGSELRAISLSQNAPVLRIVPDLADARWAAAVTYGRIHRVDLNLGVETAVAEVGIWRALAYSHDGTHLYAGVYRAEADEHHLLKLTASDLALLDEVRLSSAPRAVLVDSTGDRVYVALPEEHAVLTLNAAGLEPLWRANVGREPVGLLCMDGVLYVACAGSDQVARLDPTTGERSAPIPLAARIAALSTGPEGMLAALGAADQVAVLRDSEVQARWPAGPDPQRLAWLPELEQVAVLSPSAGTLTLHDRHGTVVAAHPVRAGADALYHDITNRRLYAGDLVLDLATGITATVVVTTALGAAEAPALVAVDSARDITYLVAGNGVLGSNSGLMAYRLEDDGTTTAGGPGRLSLVDLCYDEELDLFYSLYQHMGAYGLQVWDPATGSERLHLPLERRPIGLALNPITHHLWLALGEALPLDASSGGALRAYDTGTMDLVTEMALSGPVTALSVDTREGRVYAGCDTDQGVWVIQDLPMPEPSAATSRPATTP